MRYAPQIILFLLAILLNSCSFLPFGIKQEKQEKESLSYQDSLAITSKFIEAKKEALLGNDELAI